MTTRLRPLPEETIANLAQVTEDPIDAMKFAADLYAMTAFCAERAAATAVGAALPLPPKPHSKYMRMLKKGLRAKLAEVAGEFDDDELDRLKRIAPAFLVRMDSEPGLSDEIVHLVCMAPGDASRVDPRPPRRHRGEVRVVIDLTHELTAWLRSTDARMLMKEIVAEAIQAEIRTALEDELVDVERAAEMLVMSQGALRKAVERGQVPCQRIGNRLRFRRMDLISSRGQARPKARVATR